MTSLPVPDSPMSKQGTSEAATLPAWAMRRRIWGASPTISRGGLAVELDGGALAVDDLELGLPQGEHGAHRDTTALEPRGAHEGAVGGAEIVHLHAVIRERELGVKVADTAGSVNHVVVLGLPDGDDLALRLNGGAGVGPFEELDGERLHHHVRWWREACSLRHGAGL
ncbi:MAG: hypothetical protein R3B72_41465 [Polyangiaceae bacterium]